MTLFNDTDLFFSGMRGKIIYDLPDTELILIDNFFTKEESDHYYELLLHQTKWKEYEMEIFDKTVKAPRMIAWYQDKENINSNQNIPDWSPELLKIRERVENETALNFNSALLNLYRNGNDSVAWHSDQEGNSGPNPVIASVTFGESRMFKLRHKLEKTLLQLKFRCITDLFFLWQEPRIVFGNIRFQKLPVMSYQELI